MKSAYAREAFMDGVRSIVSTLVLILLSLLASSLLLTLSGFEWTAAFEGIYEAVTDDIGGTIRWTIPLILTGLAVATSFRANIFNIGVDGQLYMGAVVATAAGLYLPVMPPVVAICVVVLLGSLAGALYAAIPGFLKARWNTDEVVSTLLLNFVAVLFTDFLVLGIMKAPGATGTSFTSEKISESLWLSRIIPGSQAHTGLYVAVFTTLCLWLVLSRSTLGYSINMVGANPEAARYSGISSGKVTLAVFLIAGAIAGLAGSMEILGVHHRFPGRFNAGLGFDGVVVALLAKNHPIGVLFAAFFFGALRNGSMNMERLTDVPRSMVEIIQVIVIVALTANVFRVRRRRAIRDNG